MKNTIDNTQRKRIYRRDGYRCALCDSTRYIQIHHAIPRGQGGPNTDHNLITLCSDCHGLAHGMDLRGWGASAADVEQAIVEYLADYYACQGVIWNPWGAQETPAPVRDLLDSYENCALDDDPWICRYERPTPP